MPGISALELPNRLQDRGIDLPVIFVTADYSNATRDRIRTAGGCAYFKKPVDDQALIDMIRWTTAKA
jgi:FixJ family two-component response regulator